MTINIDINAVIGENELARRIFVNLSDEDLSKCSSVCRTWYHAVKDAQSYQTFEITPDQIGKLNKKTKGLTANQKEALENFIKTNVAYAREVVIYGFSSGTYIPDEVYENIFNSRLAIRTIVLRGRGSWNKCYCPKQGTTCGEQYDNVKSEHKTNLEAIHITSKFEISSCALLDLISRSPKLKSLRFYGRITLHDHLEKFNSKRFHCDLESLYWPYPDRDQMLTLALIVKRNENITTLYSNFETTCDFLSSECLLNLRFLSLLMNEKWSCKSGKVKRPYKHLNKTKYLALAKNVEALEIRSLLPEFNTEDETTIASAERIYEEFILSFWKYVAKIPNLKYLAVYGAWDLDKICREMAKHGMQVEYLKINLTPISVINAINNGDDGPVLSMVDSLKNLRKLPKLRSLHYICCDLLSSIDNKTVLAFKEIIDLIWILDIKVCLTDDVEDLLTNIYRRAYQQGRLYSINLRIQAKNSSNASPVVKKLLKFPTGANLKDRLLVFADEESSERYGRNSFESIQIWEVRHVASLRDESTYRKLKESWRLYDEKFYSTLKYV